MARRSVSSNGWDTRLSSVKDGRFRHDVTTAVGAYRSPPLAQHTGGMEDFRAMVKLLGGVDLGGTKIQTVVVDGSHAVVGQARRPTPGEGGPAAVASAIADALRDAAHDAGVEPAAVGPVGIGSPGSVDKANGTVTRALNVSAEWTGSYPLAAEVGDRFGCASVRLGNDVEVGTRAEFELGAGRGYRSLIGVFWGTGVGGGLILDGEPWKGRGAAGEIGHMVVQIGGARCTCGRKGCIEAYAGRRAMELRARELVDRGRKTDLFEIMADRGRTELSSGVWARALRHNDALAEHLIDRAVGALAAGIASAINLLDLEAVVIGGGLGTRLGQPYVERIEKRMRPHLFRDDRPPAVRLAELGDLGGAVGAALLAGSAAGLTPA
jgi:glucokinase